MAPLDGAIYANLMRVANLSDQGTLGSVLDVALSAAEPSCAADAGASRSSLTSSPCRAKVWLQATGSNVSLGSPSMDSTGFHLLAGTDASLGDGFHLGAEAGAAQINATTPVGGNGQIRNVHEGLYAFLDTGPMVLSATLDAAQNRYRVNRATGVGLAHADPHGNTLSAGLQAAFPTALSGSLWLTPKFGVLYEHQTLGHFNEQITSSNPLAPAYAVTGLRDTTSSLQPYAGVDFTDTIRAGQVTYVPQLDLGFRYQSRNHTENSTQLIAQDGTQFAVPGSAMGRSVMGDVNARITAKMDGSWDVYLSYDGLFASHLHDNALSVGFTKRF